MNRIPINVPINYPLQSGGGHVRRLSSGNTATTSLPNLNINVEPIPYHHRVPPSPQQQQQQQQQQQLQQQMSRGMMMPTNLPMQLLNVKPELLGTPSSSSTPSYSTSPISRQSGTSSPFTMQLHHAQAMLQSFKPGATKRKSSDPNDPFTASGALKLKRKIRKNTREKQRRSELNDKFDQLCEILQLGGGQTKIEKFTILSEAINVIAALRKEVNDLRTDKRELRNELKKMTSVLENAFPSNPELAKEFTNRFFPILSALSPSESSPNSATNENANAALISPFSGNTNTSDTTNNDDDEMKSTITTNTVSGNLSAKQPSPKSVHATTTTTMQIPESTTAYNFSNSLSPRSLASTQQQQQLQQQQQQPHSPKAFLESPRQIAALSNVNKVQSLNPSLPPTSQPLNTLSSSPHNPFQQQPHHHRHHRSNSNSSLFGLGIPSPTQPMAFSFSNFNNNTNNPNNNLNTPALPLGSTQFNLQPFSHGSAHTRKPSFPGHDRSNSFSKLNREQVEHFANPQQLGVYPNYPAAPYSTHSNMAISPSAATGMYQTFSFGQPNVPTHIPTHPPRRPSQEYKISLSSLHGLSPTSSPTHNRRLSGNAFNFNLNVTLPPYEDSNTSTYDPSFRYANPSPVTHPLVNFVPLGGANDLPRHTIKSETDAIYGFQSMDEDLMIRDYS
jgi:hypothetical protein